MKCRRTGSCQSDEKGLPLRFGVRIPLRIYSDITLRACADGHLRREFFMKKTKSLRVIACAAVCAALSIVLGKFAAIPIGNTIRISFENLPIIFCSVAFGPAVGGACGAVADLLGCLLRGYDINPLITLAAAAMGIVPGTLTKYVFRSRTALPVATSALASHAVCSVVLKTLALHIAYAAPLGALFAQRGLTYAAIAPIEAYLCILIMKNGAVKKELAANDREKDMHHGKIRDRKAIGERK